MKRVIGLIIIATVMLVALVASGQNPPGTVPFLQAMQETYGSTTPWSSTAGFTIADTANGHVYQIIITNGVLGVLQVQ